jgi:SAM-dependent methyltransferase
MRTGVADLRSLDRDVAERFDAVVSFDNALPHLLTDEDLAAAAGALRSVLRPGGVLCASIRDYDAALEERPSGELPRTFGTGDGERVVFQVWDWHDDDRYTVRYFLLEARAGRWRASERRTTYRALRRDALTSVLHDAGFAPVEWLLPDQSGFYQPVVVARAPS